MANKPNDMLRMSWQQRVCAYIAIVAFGVPSLLIALVGGELWPFLDYRMYADAKLTPESEWLALVGRTSSGAAFPLADESYIVPFAHSELLRALYALDILGDTDATPARRALQGLLAAYERDRLAGAHNGPRLISLEVYRIRWQARPDRAHDAPPDSQDFLLATHLLDATP